MLFCIFYLFPWYQNRKPKFKDLLINLSKKQKKELRSKIIKHLKKGRKGKNVAVLIKGLESKEYIHIPNFNKVLKIVNRQRNVYQLSQN